MPNCREIHPHTWEHARQALVYYFYRHTGGDEAEDLAQQTLLALWRRQDYNFEREEDFLRVCFAFARNVLQQGRRNYRKHSVELPIEWASQVCAPGVAPEAEVLLEEVLRIGSQHLSESDWRLIVEAIDKSPSEMDGVTNADIANRVRVRLSRARKRLATLIKRKPGWSNE